MLLTVVRRFAASWRDAFWDVWRWPEASLLQPLVQSTFEADLAVERERALWREAVGLPADRGRFIQREWRRRIERLESLDEGEKARLAASLRGRYAMEAEEAGGTGSLRVVNTILEAPEASLLVFREEFVEAFEGLMRAGAEEGALQLGFAVDWTLEHPEALRHMETYAGHYGDRLTKLVPMEWQVEVRKELIAGLDAGEGAVDMGRRIQGVWSDLRGWEAERIARTEAVRADMEGRRAMYKESGVATVIWIAHPGCCDRCDALDGRRLPVDSPYLPPIHPHCRCDAPPSPESTAALRASAFEGLE